MSTPKKHAPELVEAALAYFASQFTNDQRKVFVAAYSHDTEDLDQDEFAEYVLRTRIAALTAENERLTTKLAAFEGAEEITDRHKYNQPDGGRRYVFETIKGVRLFIVRPKSSAPDDRKCPKCGGALALTDGWVPTHSNPDNSGLDPSAEPYCPKCDTKPESEGKS